MTELLLLLAMTGIAPDSLTIGERTEEHTSLAAEATEFAYSGSMANAYYQFSTSLSNISAGATIRREEQAANPWEGSRMWQGAFDAQSYLRISDQMVARASAGYDYGRYSDVCWNSTADYPLLYPYVLADSVGGRLTHEQYRFSGAVAHRTGRWVYALEGDYRAVQDFRDRDPRPRCMLTDLSIDASANYRLSDSYAVGAEGGIRFYKQVMDVEYMAQTGANSTQFHFTGLGQTFGRIDGTTYTETRHKGLGYRGALSLIPLTGKGVHALLSYSQLKMDRRIHELNETPVTTLITHTAEASAAYTLPSARMTHTAAVNVRYQQRRGSQAVIDNGLLGEFAILDRHAMYDMDTWTVRAALTGEYNLSADGRHRFSACAAVSMLDFTEKYLDPAARRSFRNLLPELTARYRMLSGEWLLQGGVQARYVANLDGSLSIPPADTRGEIRRHICYEYDRMTDNCTELTPSIMAQRNVGRNGALFASASMRARFHNYGPDNSFSITIGYRF